MTHKSNPVNGMTQGLEPSGRSESIRRLGPLDMLLLAAWCGLAAGWLEVGTRLLLRHFTGRMSLLSRQFVWLVPLSNLLLFFVAGLFLATATKLWPRPAGWFNPRLICAVALMPAVLVAMPQIYPWAWLLVTAGFATRLAPWLERPRNRWRRWMIWSLPGPLGLVAVVAGFVFGGDWLKERQETRRPLPPAGSPNVLLIVLDTVRADCLGVYGYPRATTPALDRLAKGAIRFDEARATAPWTLASHASMFTGRWPHDLNVRWQQPFPDRETTLAEYLGSRGFATAGFVANTQYCSYDTGLNRGFTHFEDYLTDLKHLRPLRTAVLFSNAWDGIAALGMRLIENRYNPVLNWLLINDRKHAVELNREFVTWLYYREDKKRPFFAFLNYFDAHSPYLPPEGVKARFGAGPRTPTEFLVLTELWQGLDKLSMSQDFVNLIQDSYDNCLAFLDACLGQLLEALENDGVLKNTVVIITADHGEELGDHTLFEHGESLYRPEIHVPLLIKLPSKAQPPVVIRRMVSLRDLPATIVDLAGLADGSPFPGQSLARLWRDPAQGAASGDPALEGVFSELSAPSPVNPSKGRSPAVRGPLVSLAQDDYVYIRNEGDGKEELFHERDDPRELVNLAGVEAMQPLLRRFRQSLDRVKSGPARTPPRAP
jgi:arylsulfatase A-like enzyme